MKNYALLYFRGFHSRKCEHSAKYLKLKDYFDDTDVFEIELNYDNENDYMSSIETLCKKYSRVGLVGDSLGAIPSLYLHSLTEYPLVLINPSYYPEITLKDDLSEEMKDEINFFKNKIEENKSKLFFRFEQAKDDERVDYARFYEHFKFNAELVNFHEKGGHKFDCIDDDLLHLWNLYLFFEIDELFMLFEKHEGVLCD